MLKNVALVSYLGLSFEHGNNMDTYFLFECFKFHLGDEIANLCIRLAICVEVNKDTFIQRWCNGTRVIRRQTIRRQTIRRTTIHLQTIRRMGQFVDSPLLGPRFRPL
jgi:hypothetical protein